jgi:hypothetical protein
MSTYQGANAGFVDNYADWQGLGDGGRKVYIYGLVDRAVYDKFKGEETYLTARRNGLMNCAFSQKLTHEIAAEAITRHYQTYPADSRIPPAVVFDDVAQNICIDPINAQRARFGLPAWKVLTGAILAK